MHQHAAAESVDACVGVQRQKMCCQDAVAAQDLMDFICSIQLAQLLALHSAQVVAQLLHLQ